MSLSDQETLELTALCNALVDGTATTAARERLAQLLANSPAGREFYVRFMELSASLFHYAAELPVEVPVRVATPQPAWWSRGIWWAGGALAAAAAALFLVWFGNFPAHEKPMVLAQADQPVIPPVNVENNPQPATQGPQDVKPDRAMPDSQTARQQPNNPVPTVLESQADLENQPSTHQAPVGVEASPEFVAQVIGVEDCRWGGRAVSLKPDDQLQSGQRLELAAGVVEIAFDSGAQVTLEGPATLEVNSAWKATLLEGKLDAIVPAEAIGFRIANPFVDVVDLGTEFSMVATQNGETEVYVHKGQVQTLPHDASGHNLSAILLKADQSWTFGRKGNAEIKNPKTKTKAAVKIHKNPHFRGNRHITGLINAAKVQDATPGNATGIAKHEKHPQMSAAIHELEEAKKELQEAAHDFGGHREDALRAVDKAIEQLRKALEGDRKQDRKRTK